MVKVKYFRDVHFNEHNRKNCWHMQKKWLSTKSKAPMEIEKKTAEKKYYDKSHTFSDLKGLCESLAHLHSLFLRLRETIKDFSY